MEENERNDSAPTRDYAGEVINIFEAYGWPEPERAKLLSWLPLQTWIDNKTDSQAIAAQYKLDLRKLEEQSE